MDPITLGFYALVCGALSAFAPASLKPLLRFGIGAVVGIVAATILPMLRGIVGY